MKHVGFTGTQRGMTRKQYERLQELLPAGAVLHHGDCIGADEQCHSVGSQKGCTIIIHPSTSLKRAFCRGHEVRLPKPPLKRNLDIVKESEELLATPRGFKEELRSGTWTTIRLARKHKKPITLIWPDGNVATESP